MKQTLRKYEWPSTVYTEKIVRGREILFYCCPQKTGVKKGTSQGKVSRHTDNAQCALSVSEMDGKQKGPFSFTLHLSYLIQTDWRQISERKKKLETTSTVEMTDDVVAECF